MIVRLATWLASVSGLLASCAVDAFAFTALIPRIRPLATTAATVRSSSTPVRSARLAAVTATPWGFAASGPSWQDTTGEALTRRARRGGSDDEEPPNIPGSGLRGVDTSGLTGTNKRDADWFRRTAEREARGNLQWFEDPVIYIALFALVPLFIGAWGVVNCYIPGLCTPN